MKENSKEKRPRKLLSKIMYDLISGIMQKEWICPHCLSKNVEHWHSSSTAFDKFGNTVKTMYFGCLFFRCTDCDKEFHSDRFFPQENWREYRECIIDETIKKEIIGEVS